MKGEAFAEEVVIELAAAQAKHRPMHSLHEGLAVLWEEFEEAKAEVFKKHPDLTNLRKELVQIAAMAARMTVELIDSRKA